MCVRPRPPRDASIRTRASGTHRIRLRGRARVLDAGEELERALALLREKYRQYRDDPPAGPVLAVDVTEVREWSANAGP
jgi:hypothetical protein